MARELLVELGSLVQGVYLMPAFNHFDLVAEIIEEVRSPSSRENQPGPTETRRLEGGWL